MKIDYELFKKIVTNKKSSNRYGRVAIQNDFDMKENDARFYDQLADNPEVLQLSDVKTSEPSETINTDGPKIFVFDIETAPLKGYFWRLWKQNIPIDAIESEWFMLTWAGKWLFEDTVFTGKVTPEEVKNEDDKRICESLWSFIDEADIVISHHGDKFDIPRINTRFLLNGLKPPSPFRSIDTKKAAMQFNFSSNKLDFIARQFGVGQKKDTNLELWLKCMDGDQESLDYMEEYNIEDVKILEDVYVCLRPFIKNHPNVTVWMDGAERRCSICGSDDIEVSGEYTTNVNIFTSYRCNSCGGLAGRERKSLITTNQKHNIIAPIAR